MTLLQEIQNASASTEARVADLLRKCKMLAVRLKSNELGEWVEQELNGYKNKDELPNYRRLTQLHSCGNFDRGFGAILANAPISPYLLPKKYQELVKNEFLGDGAPVYEDLINASDKGDSKDSFQVLWPDALVGILNREREVYCINAWKVIPRSALARLLDTVINRILLFALDIEKENPQAEEADVKNTPVPEPVVSQVFHSHFYGDVGNIATGSHHFEQYTVFNQLWQNANIDLSQLAKELPVLRNALLSEAKEPEHYEAIGAVRSAEIEAEKRDGLKVLGHLSKVGRWGLDVATQIGTQIAVEAIKQAMKN